MMLKLVLGAGAALCLTAGVAVANEPVERISGGFAVHYDDLDLHSRAGQAELTARIDRAANRVCHLNYPNELAAANACRRELTEATVRNAAPEVRTALGAQEPRRVAGVPLTTH